MRGGEARGELRVGETSHLRTEGGEGVSVRGERGGMMGERGRAVSSEASNHNTTQDSSAQLIRLKIM